MILSRIHILFIIPFSAFYFMQVFAEKEDEICMTIETSIKYYDRDFRSIKKETRSVTSSEKFLKLSNTFSQSKTVGGGVDLGFNAFSLGFNAEVTNAWSKSTSSEIKTTDYREDYESGETVFAEGSRQLFKETTVEIKIEIKRTEGGSNFETSTAKSVSEVYEQSVDKEKCPYVMEDKLTRMAQRDIRDMREESKDKDQVEIVGAKQRTLRETKCGIEGKYRYVLGLSFPFNLLIIL